MLTKIPIADMSHEDWLAERRKSLGGSDVGAIVGLHRYATPYTVWAEKTGRIPPKEDNEAMRQGRDLERYVAERFTERSGKKVQRYSYLLRDGSVPYLHANIDRRVVGERSGLECKTASSWNAALYAGGGFPESYYAQCVAYLAVTGWERWYLAALVLGQSFHIYQITTIADDGAPEWCEGSVYVGPDEIDALKRCASEFWENYVVPDEPPPPDGLDPTGEAIQEIYADDDGGTVELFGRDGLLEDYFRLCAEREETQRRIEAIKQTIQMDMGESTGAVCAAAHVSWKLQHRRSFDPAAFRRVHPEISLEPFYKQTQSRVFKITREKET